MISCILLDKCFCKLLFPPSFLFLKSFSLEMMSDNWALLSNREKANIKKTISEIAIMVISAIGGGLVFEAAKDHMNEVGQINIHPRVNAVVSASD